MKNQKTKKFMLAYKKCHKAFQGYCMALTYGKMDAEDLIQDALEAAYKNFEQIEEGKLKRYLIKTARNIFIDYLRKENVKKRYVESFDSRMLRQGARADLLIDAKILYEALDKLPELQKDAVSLFYISGFRQKEIAEIQGRAVGAVKKSVHVGFHTLKDLLLEPSGKDENKENKKRLFLLLMLSEEDGNDLFRPLRELPAGLSLEEVEKIIEGFGGLPPEPPELPKKDRQNWLDGFLGNISLNGGILFMVGIVGIAIVIYWSIPDDMKENKVAAREVSKKTSFLGEGIIAEKASGSKEKVIIPLESSYRDIGTEKLLADIIFDGTTVITEVTTSENIVDTMVLAGIDSMQIDKGENIVSLSEDNKRIKERLPSILPLDLVSLKSSSPEQILEKIILKNKDNLSVLNNCDSYVTKIKEPEMVMIKGGTFTRGCTKEQQRNCEKDEMPVHDVIIDNFSIGKYEVTNEEFVVFLNSDDNQGKEGGDFWGNLKQINQSTSSIKKKKGCFIVKSGHKRLPVTNVSWYGTQAYVKWLSKVTRKSYRLPTEAEWEYAARGGLDSNDFDYAGSDAADEVAWFGRNSNHKVHIVGVKKANELGLYDMSGNVREWCSDWYSKTYYQDLAIQGLANNPQGPSTGSRRILRGGSWFNLSVSKLRCSNRFSLSPDSRNDYYGFRLVQD